MATQTFQKLGVLKTRSEFLHVREGRYAARGALVVQMRDNPERRGIGMGFTATKKVGNAVIRNRAKRRLREVARALLPELGRSGHDYVFIARSAGPRSKATTERAWTDLLDDARKALITLSRRTDAAAGEQTENTA